MNSLNAAHAQALFVELALLAVIGDSGQVNSIYTVRQTTVTLTVFARLLRY